VINDNLVRFVAPGAVFYKKIYATENKLLSAIDGRFHKSSHLILITRVYLAYTNCPLILHLCILCKVKVAVLLRESRFHFALGDGEK